ncbi:MAG TPA: hypothetical protein VM364_16110 [Vicinamibacterales bacterium]|nr:hypothetical protein [Vicinamibacterales bacterium]HWI20712.1 hypothetical protein [Vicinamibacterales bacterium]
MSTVTMTRTPHKCIATVANAIRSGSERRYSRVNRIALAEAVSAFHSRTGLAPARFDMQLEAIRGGATIVRLAHQPNFLPYDNLLLQLRYLHHLQQTLLALGEHVVSIVFLVDHDVATNRRFRISQVFDPSDKALLRRIRYPVAEPHKQINAQPVPSQRYFTELAELIESLSRLLQQDGSRPPRPLSDIAADLGPPVQPTLGTTEVTAYAWMRVAYVHGFAPNVLFVPLSALHGHLRPVYVDLSRQLGPDPKGFEYYWTVCPSCQGRERIRRNTDCVDADCTNCGLVRQRDPLTDESIRIIPRVALDILADYVGLDVAGGTSYGSGAPYLSESARLAQRIGIPVPPEVAWRVEILHTGLAGVSAYRLRGGSTLPVNLRDILVTGRMGLAHYLAVHHELSSLRDAFDLHAVDSRIPDSIEIDPHAATQLKSWLRSSMTHRSEARQ